MQSVETQNVEDLGVCLSLHWALPSDEPLLFRLYALQHAHDRRLPGWDERIAELFLKTKFRAQQISELLEHPDARRALIFQDQEPIGSFLLDDAGDEYRVIDLFLRKEYRSREVAEVLTSLLRARAARENRSLSILAPAVSAEADLLLGAGFFRVEGKKDSQELRWHCPISEHDLAMIV